MRGIAHLRAVLLLLFTLSCSENVPPLDPEDLVRGYTQKVLFLEEGMDSCVDFALKYGFLLKEGERITPSEKEARVFCKSRLSVRVRKARYDIHRAYRNDEKGKANYTVIVWITRPPYQKEVVLEKVEGRWRFYLH